MCSTLNTASLTYPAHLDREAVDGAQEDIADSKHSAASSSKKENFLPTSQDQETEQKDDRNNGKRKKVSKFWWRVAYCEFSHHSEIDHTEKVVVFLTSNQFSTSFFN